MAQYLYKFVIIEQVIREAFSIKSTDVGHSHESGINVNMPEPMDTLEVFEHRSDIIEEFQNSVDANNVSVLVYLVWGKVSRCDIIRTE